MRYRYTFVLLNLLLGFNCKAQDFGNALSFDGVDDYVSIPHSAGLNLGSAFTLEAWVYVDNSSDQFQVFLHKWQTNQYTLELYNNKLNFVIRTSDGFFVLASPNDLPRDRWVHIAGVRNGATMYVYEDGVLTNSQTITGTTNTAASGELVLGRRSEAAVDPMQGKMDEVKIWNVARSSTQIANIYSTLVGNEAGLVSYYDFNSGILGGNNSSMTKLRSLSNVVYDGVLNNFSLTGATSNWFKSFPGASPSSDKPVAYYPFNGNAIDESENSNDGTVFGALLASDGLGNSNGAYQFNGTSDYIDMGNDPSLDLRDGFSISAWIYTTGTGTYQTIVSRGWEGNGEYDLELYYNGSSYFINAYLEDERFNGTVPVPDGWNHIAIVAKTGANGVKTYINGELANQWTTTRDLVGTAPYNFRIGNSQRDEDYFFNGFIDDVSIYNMALSSLDVSALSNGIKSNFYGGSFGNALDFDGAKDYTEIPKALVSNLTDFTFETWFKWDGGDPNQRLFEFGFLNTDFLSITASRFTIYRIYSIPGGGNQEHQICFSSDCTGTLPVGTWNHLAITLDAALQRGTIYLNGEEISNNTTAGTFFDYDAPNTIVNGPFTFTPNDITSNLNIQFNRFGSGASGSYPFDGQLDETRLWNVAKSKDEIESALRAPLAGNEANLVYYYNYDQGIAGGDNSSIDVLKGATPNSDGYFTGFDLTGNQSNFVASSLARGKIVVSEVRPASAIPGAPVTIYGGGFIPLAGYNKVYIDGLEASIVEESKSAIKVIVPSGFNSPLSVKNLEVRNSFGVSQPYPFTVLENATGVGFTFREQTVSNYLKRANNIQSADFNSDGHFDLVAGGDGIDVFLNDKQGKFPSKSNIAPLVDRSSSIEVGDLDGDGDMDILTTFLNDPNGLGWFENDGAGNFSAQNIIPGVNLIYRAAMPSDLDNDGDLDVVMIGAITNLTPESYDDEGVIIWYPNDGNGNFSAGKVIFQQQNFETTYIHTTDIDGDQDFDLVFTGINFYGGLPNWEPLILLSKNEGGGVFSAPVFVTNSGVNNTAGLASADLNGDDRMDILSASLVGGFYWYRQEVDGSFTQQGLNGSQPVDVSVGDMNADGLPDFISGNYISGGIAWFPNMGTGSFPRNTIAQKFVEPHELISVDLDSDGDLDVVSTWSQSDRLVAYIHILTDKNIESFSLSSQVGTAVIDIPTRTVDITVPNNTDRTQMTPSFTLSKLATAYSAGTEQISGVTRGNFNSPFIYSIVAEDESAIDWTVNVHPLPGIPVLNSITSITQVGGTINWTAGSFMDFALIDVSTDNFASFISGYDAKEVTGVSSDIVGLQAGSTYQIRIRGKSQYGLSQSFSNVITLVTLPEASQLNAVTGITQTTASLSWLSVTGATSYQIDLSKDNFSTFVQPYNNFNVLTNNLSLTGLSAGTVYQVRLRTANNSGVSPNFTNTTFTTIPPEPVAAQESAKTSTTFTANWNIAPTATSYIAELSDNNFVSVLQTDTTTSTSVAYNSLTLGKSYAYRVRATNASGTSSYSNAVIVVPSYSVTISNDSFDAASKTASVTTTSASGIDSVKLFYRGIRTGEFQSINVPLKSGNTYDMVISPEMQDIMGAEYYFQVRDGLGDKRIGKLGYTYRRIEATEKETIPFTRFGRGASNYTLFSIPYQLDDPSISSVFDPVLGSYKTTKWRLIRYQDGRNVDYGEGLNKLEPGKGYWFASLDQATIQVGQASVVTANRTLPYSLNLQKGWNQIGNPFPFDVSWNDVIDQNASVSGIGNLYVFEDGSFKKGDLKVWGGGFVKSEIDVSISIPLTELALSGGRRGDNEIKNRDISQSNWILPLSLKHGDAFNDLGAIGMHEKASLSNDEFDEQSLPRFINYLELNSYHPEYFLPKFMRDIVPTANAYNWSFDVESNNVGATVTISWDPYAMGDNEAQLFLYDEAGQQLIDMKMDNAYSFEFNGKRNLRFFYSIDRVHLTPNFDGVGKPYPNPFNSITSIPLLVGSENGNVSCGVFDLTGRQVKSILKGGLNQGYDELQWDGTDNRGNRLPSGIYLYRLRMGTSKTFIGKVILE